MVSSSVCQQQRKENRERKKTKKSKNRARERGARTGKDDEFFFFEDVFVEIESCRVENVDGNQWLRFSSITYIDPTGEERTWDAATRTTKDPNAVADAVCVFAKLKSSKRETQTLLVRQFRPPMERETIELPAGLIDKGETAEQAALRELKEETGYTGYNAKATPCSMALSPGLSNETVVLVTVDVNLDEYEEDEVEAMDKVVPEQELEGSEFITVIKVPLNKMRESLDSLNSSGYKIFAGLYMFALGLELNEAD